MLVNQTHCDPPEPILAFLDETGTPGTYAVVGLAFSRTEEVTKLAVGLESVRNYAIAAFGVDQDVEFHGHEIMNHKGGWAALKGKTRAKIAIYSKAMAVIANCDLTYFIRGVDKNSVNRSYRRQVSFHELALQYQLESLNDFGKRSNRLVSCIADDLQSAAEHRLELVHYQSNGIPGYRSSRLEMIQPPIHFLDSRNSWGIQAVDLLAYAFQRAYWQPASAPASIAAARKLIGQIPQSRCGELRIWRRG